jgi:hypothetical protein
VYDLEKGWLKSDAAAADHEDDPAKWTEGAHYEALARNICGRQRRDAGPSVP